MALGYRWIGIAPGFNLVVAQPLAGWFIKSDSVAVRAAHEGSAEPGDLFWLDAKDMLNFSLYLEPEVVSERSVQMLPVAMVAFAEAMGAIAADVRVGGRHAEEAEWR